jgi:hypothetical protein
MLDRQGWADIKSEPLQFRSGIQVTLDLYGHFIPGVDRHRVEV